MANNNSLSSSSNNNPSLTSYNESSSFISPEPVQQTMIDDDISLPLDTTSYVDLQPRLFNLILQSSSLQQTSLTEEEETDKIRRDFMDTCKISRVLY